MPRKYQAWLRSRQKIECVAPAFEGAAEPFDAAVHVSLDGQSYPEGAGATFRYEGAAGKKK